MGEEISAGSFSRRQRSRYRHKVGVCLDVLERMLSSDAFTDAFTDDLPLAGLEVELDLVDAALEPLPANLDVLEEIGDPSFQTELGAFNLEINIPPILFAADGARVLEGRLQRSVDLAERAAARLGGHVVMIGTLPTLTQGHLEVPGWMSPSPRYAALNNSILAARGEEIRLDIDGAERLTTTACDLSPESACTSVQLHLQVAPDRFADVWNAAQLIAGPQLALGANSPYLFGRQLWHETRVELFAQSTDCRPPELTNQGARPRVWFGERWATSVIDLFAENLRYFPALLAELGDEDPVAELEAGHIPLLRELRLHNGTVYRWNRPVYDVVDGRPHVRIENRVLPSGPTVIDVMANAAFFYGAVHALSIDERPLWTALGFPAAEANFFECARHGMEATCSWPGLGTVTAVELLRRHLLATAHEGLERLGVDRDVRERLLRVVEDRARTGRNGATWQTATVHALQRRGLTRDRALTRMLGLYHDGMRTGEPVHTWPVPS
jgi:gamma-glutamyl:cysteine ligase YbdK (ATP-grasp superfamily)